MTALARWGLGCALAMLVGTGAAAAADEEYRFDASEFEKKPFEFGGYLELRPERFWLNPGSVGYRLNYPNGATRDTLDSVTGTLELTGKFTRGIASFQFRTHSDVQRSNTVNQESNSLYDALLSVRPDPGFTADLGKQAFQWGKGYAWTTVGFVQRPKDPNNPDLARQGYVVASADIIRNFDGPLQTVALTPVVLPVNSRVNDDYGAGGHVNLAAKLYLLYLDTDIDLMYLAKGSRPASVGADFSRNVGTNLEFHGEIARISDATKPIVDSTGRVTTERVDAINYLLGMRYLTERDTTFIVEYYRNGLGYTGKEIEDYYHFVDQALGQLAPGSTSNAMQTVRKVTQGGYGQPNPMRNYLYARITQKEPFDILYFTPALTTIVNVGDRSYQVTPELLYTGVTNLELRLRLYLLEGGSATEFGEKQNSRRLELRVRYYF